MRMHATRHSSSAKINGCEVEQRDSIKTAEFYQPLYCVMLQKRRGIRGGTAR